MKQNKKDRYLRSLGPFEQVIDLYMHRNPVQFSLTAELTRDVSEAELRRALQKLRLVHPLLAAEVVRKDRDNQGAVITSFHQSEEEIPIRVARDTTWQHEAALEQTKTIEPVPGPLLRAVLIPANIRRNGVTLILTFAHQITDGRGALSVIEDLSAILDGAKLAPKSLPAAQEELLANLAPTITPDEDTARRGTELLEQQSADTTASPPGQLRPFDGSLPAVQSGHLGIAGTRRLLKRARTESCTVQSALCAAAASVLFRHAKRDQVKINVPIDLRRAVNLNDEVVVRFIGTTVVLGPSSEAGFWDLARSASAQLRTARHPETVRASALALAQLAPTSADEAEEAMLAATTADIEITNLGVAHEPGLSQNIHALWGPTMTTQLAEEQILGVVTHGDNLRMVNVTHNPIADLVAHVCSELETACR